MNRRHIGIILPCILLACVVLPSCVRDEIHGVKTNYHVRYDIDYNVGYNAPDKEVEMVRLRFYDKETGKRIFEALSSPAGTDLTIAPDTYGIMAYSLDSRMRFTHEEDLALVSAGVASTETSDGQTVIAAPGHFFFGLLKDEYIPFVADDEPSYELVVPMASPLESWRVVVTGIKGLRNNRGITFFLTHQRERMLLSTMACQGDAVMQFAGYPDKEMKTVDTEFCTLGMVEDKSYLLQIQMTDAAGLSYHKTVDVTDQILDPENISHTITFDYDVNLLEMVEGGVQPTAKEWKESYEYFVIQ